MKISIITISYNMQDCIERTIQSVLAQTYKTIEYIIVDGASSDSTLEVVNKYKDQIHKVISEPDSGIYNAMNKGLELSTGDYIVFLNAGDHFHSDDSLEKVAYYLSNNNKDLFYGDVNLVSLKGTGRVNSYKDIDKIYLLKGNIAHPSTFYKRELLKNFGGYDESYKLIADYDMHVKSLVKYGAKSMYLPFVVSDFYMDGASSQKQNQQELSKERKIILKKYFNHLTVKYYDFLTFVFKLIPNRRLQKSIRKKLANFLGYGLR